MRWINVYTRVSVEFWFMATKWLIFQGQELLQVFLFLLNKRQKKSKRYIAETIDADYANDLAFLANTPEFLLHSLEQVERGMGFYDETNFMCFNEDGAIKWSSSEISWPVHISQYQCLIYWKRYQHKYR